MKTSCYIGWEEKKLGISLAKARNISSLLSFVVVRHPFERIASTYFNKIIDRGHLVGNLSSSRFYKISPQILCPIQEWSPATESIIRLYREHNIKNASEKLSTEYPRSVNTYSG